MQERQRGFGHEIQLLLLERRVGFGREACDHIGADGDAGPHCACAGDCRGRVGAQMPPLHSLQDKVAADL